MIIGAQLYTLRDYCKTTEAFAQTLQRVADIGYTSVQVSGTCAYDAQWLADELKKNGLTCNLTHFSYDRIVGETEKVVAEHNTFGCKYIGVGSMPGWNADGAFEAFVERASDAAKKIAQLGSYFMYHNHNFEYEKQIDDKKLMFALSDAFPPDVLGFTLDTYWVKAGGYDPVEELHRLAGRIPCIHFKDMTVLEDGTKHFAPIGSGILDFEKIAEAAQAGGTKYAFVEQDDCYGEDPFLCLKKSYDYLTSIGLK